MGFLFTLWAFLEGRSRESRALHSKCPNPNDIYMTLDVANSRAVGIPSVQVLPHACGWLSRFGRGAIRFRRKHLVLHISHTQRPSDTKLACLILLARSTADTVVYRFL
jgi:hypothetical protein